MARLWMTSVVVALVAACGGDGDKKLSELSADELVNLCQDAADIIGEPRTVMCDGFEIDIEPPDCTNAAAMPFDAGCDVTVDQYQACNEAIAADPCVLFGGPPPAACQTLFSDPDCATDDTQ